MSDLKHDYNPPNYPGAGTPQPPQAAYGYPPQGQSPYMGQTALPGQMGVQHTTTTTTIPAAQMAPQMTGQPMMGQPMMGQPMMGQPQMGQPQMVNMGASMGVGQQPMQPQSTGVMMNVMMPGMMGMNQMTLCQQGQHARTRRYGACGIIAAIVFFPIGLIFLFLDVEEYCVRCGTRF